MTYIIVTSENSIGLCEKVNEYLAKGFECQGGVCFNANVINNVTYSYWSQAMIGDTNLRIVLKKNGGVEYRIPAK